MEGSQPKLLTSLEKLQDKGAAFVGAVTVHNDHATLVTLSGELGAGKTSFVQGMARALGVTESITSPTFVLEKVYELQGQPFSRLVHIDAYRLEGDESLKPLAFTERYADPATLIVLEWPELVEGQLPKPDHHLTFRVVRKGRELTYA